MLLLRPLLCCAPPAASAGAAPLSGATSAAARVLSTSVPALVVTRSLRPACSTSAPACSSEGQPSPSVPCLYKRTSTSVPCLYKRTSTCMCHSGDPPAAVPVSSTRRCHLAVPLQALTSRQTCRAPPPPAPGSLPCSTRMYRRAALRSNNTVSCPEIFKSSKTKMRDGEERTGQDSIKDSSLVFPWLPSQVTVQVFVLPS